MGATRAAPGPRGARDASRLRCALGPDPCGISIGPGVIPAGFWAEHGEIRLEVATSGGSSPVGGFGRWDAHRVRPSGTAQPSRLGGFVGEISNANVFQ